MESASHFTIEKISEDLYCIQENISDVNSIYRNDPLNLYLLLGTHTALLLDTGCGLNPLKPLVEKLIEGRDLLVFNSHAHWDHVLGNEEFEIVYIHENEVSEISRPYDLSGSPEIFSRYADRDFMIPPAKNIKPLHDGDIFDLGAKKIEVIHAPGHSPGSICLRSSENQLFTGDVVYYGDQFLPNKEGIPQVIDTLTMLIEICKERNVQALYPSHQQTPCDITLLIELRGWIKRIDKFF